LGAVEYGSNMGGSAKGGGGDPTKGTHGWISVENSGGNIESSGKRSKQKTGLCTSEREHLWYQLSHLHVEMGTQRGSGGGTSGGIGMMSGCVPIPKRKWKLYSAPWAVSVLGE